MSIRNKFLNHSLEYKKNTTQEIRAVLDEKFLKLKMKINKELNEDVTLNMSELDFFCNSCDINYEEVEGRNLIKEIMQNVMFDTEDNYCVGVKYNLLYIDMNVVNDFLIKKNTKHILQELSQLLCIVKLQKEMPLNEIFIIGSIPIEYVDNKQDIALLEKKIINKIEKTMNFDTFVEFFGEFEKFLVLKKESQFIYEKVLHEMESILLENPENNTIIEFDMNSKFCFNLYTFNIFLDLPLTNEIKSELLQALFIICNADENLMSNYSRLIFLQKQKIINLLKHQVSREDVIESIDYLPQILEIKNFNEEYIMNLLRVDSKNKFLIFEDGYVNIFNLDKLMTLELKEEQIVLYFIIQCMKENAEMQCTLLNRDNIKFSSFDSCCYLENLLKKLIELYSLNDILEVIYQFKQDKIFNNFDELCIKNVISNHIIPLFSFNFSNQEITFVNREYCLFNENLISEIKNLENSKLLELYLLNNDVLKNELNQKITIDKSIEKIKNYESSIKDKLKYQITESDIIDSIREIERKSNTLIKSQDNIFYEMSIALNAKEVLEIPNDVVEFFYHEESINLITFNEKNCFKLMHKELTDISKREFLQGILIYELSKVNILLMNEKETEIKIHENMNGIKNEISSMYKKLFNRVKEEEIDYYFSMITEQLNHSSKENTKIIIKIIKNKLGIKTTEIFKSML